jgi:hypothetical protein
MANTKDQVVIYINQNIPFTPEMIQQIQESIVTKYDVNVVVNPNPIIAKPIEVNSETLDQSTVLQIEADCSQMLVSMLN